MTNQDQIDALEKTSHQITDRILANTERIKAAVAKPDDGSRYEFDHCTRLWKSDSLLRQVLGNLQKALHDLARLEKIEFQERKAMEFRKGMAQDHRRKIEALAKAVS